MSGIVIGTDAKRHWTTLEEGGFVPSFDYGRTCKPDTVEPVDGQLGHRMLVALIKRGIGRIFRTEADFYRHAVRKARNPCVCFILAASEIAFDFPAVALALHAVRISQLAFEESVVPALLKADPGGFHTASHVGPGAGLQKPRLPD